MTGHIGLVETAAGDPTPVSALLAARRGTAFFSRALGDLTDSELDRTVTAGVTCRHLFAYAGYHARHLSRLVSRVDAIESGARIRWIPPTRDEVELGATLPAVALRHLHAHAAVHLDVEWRDVASDRWMLHVDTDDGAATLTDLVWQRAQLVWQQGLLIGAGVDPEVVPTNVRELVQTGELGWRVQPERAG